jgi:glycine/D-amino acid oxidase-like deaminating enzyme
VTIARRDFLKLAGVQAGLMAARPKPRVSPPPIQNPPDVVVIGAGAFGGWTAYHLRKLGAGVTLVDSWGPGNSRSTSGDETRGVRSSYGNSGYAELWITWARRAMERWKAFDEEWGRRLGSPLFYRTGDLIFREKPDAFTDRTLEWWKKLGIPHETPSVAEVVAEYPVLRLEKIGVVLYEPDAGVVRARRACQVVADALERSGGKVLTGHASLGERDGRRLASVQLAGPFGIVRGGVFVFALGPWFPKFFPELMGPRISTPMGHVHYFGTPPGDDRFTFPNLPSWNFPGVTGWPTLAPDSRGFRVRWRGDRAVDPDWSDRAFERKHDKQARKLLKERFPLLAKAPLLETRACHYEFSASRNFIIDRHPDFDNVWLVAGGSAEGFKFGPVVGEYAAQRITGVEGDPEVAEGFSLKMSDPVPETG